MLGLQLPPGERARFERLQAPARAVLDQGQVAAAQELGRSMTLEEAVAYALAGDGAPHEVVMA
jgi:hypothetical protein